MEFDVSRVYTAINADELPVGSKCIFADTLKDLKDKVLSNDDCSTYTLKAIGDEDSKDRFKDFSCTWSLVYLVELPEKKKKLSSRLKRLKKRGKPLPHTADLLKVSTPVTFFLLRAIQTVKISRKSFLEANGTH